MPPRALSVAAPALRQVAAEAVQRASPRRPPRVLRASSIEILLLAWAGVPAALRVPAPVPIQVQRVSAVPVWPAPQPSRLVLVTVWAVVVAPRLRRVLV